MPLSFCVFMVPTLFRVNMFICETIINVSLPLKLQSRMKNSHAMQQHCDFFWLYCRVITMFLHGSLIQNSTQAPIGKSQNVQPVSCGMIKSVVSISTHKNCNIKFYH